MSRTLARPVLIRRTMNPADALIGAFRASVSRVRREMRIRRDQRHLKGMPDYILKDVGIHRSEIGAITRFGQGPYRADRTG
ncbi:MAG TPA: DUF1127 domain-containing protein [Thermohalobaculum sp.]|nr:DUF1127 domain-containing protein [Thermohalobaculum sp.]